MESTREQDEGNPLWPSFVEFCESNAVLLDNDDDYQPWWLCFQLGAIAGVNLKT